jgi:predicted secreted protein
MAKFNGTDLLVYVGNVPVAHALSHTLTVNVDLPDATTKDSLGWEDHIRGARNWEVSGDGLLDFAASYGAEQIFTSINGRTDITVKFGLQSGRNYTGTCSVESLEMSADAEQPAAYSFTFKGKGVLTSAAS